MHCHQYLSILENLLVYTPKRNPNHARVLAELGFKFLYGTGEEQRAFALESELSKALKQDDLPIKTLAEVLQTLGDIYKILDKIDNSLECFQRYFTLRKTLVTDFPTLENRRKLAISINSLGDIYTKRNQFKNALVYYHSSLKINEKLVDESPTSQKIVEMWQLFSTALEIFTTNVVN